MKVAELIALLQKMPQDANVMRAQYEEYDGLHAENISEVHAPDATSGPFWENAVVVE